MRKDQARDWHGRFVKENKEPEELFIVVEDPVIDPGQFFTEKAIKSCWFYVGEPAVYIKPPVEEETVKLTCGEGLSYNPDACVAKRADIEEAWDAFDKRHHSEVLVALAIGGLVTFGFLVLLVIMAVCNAS